MERIDFPPPTPPQPHLKKRKAPKKGADYMSHEEVLQMYGKKEAVAEGGEDTEVTTRRSDVGKLNSVKLPPEAEEIIKSLGLERR
jgi:hypothetical protein